MKNRQLIYGLSVLLMAGLLPSSLFAKMARSNLHGVRAPLRAPAPELAPVYRAVNDALNLTGAPRVQLEANAGRDALDVIEGFARQTHQAVNTAVSGAVPLSTEAEIGLGLMGHANQIVNQWNPGQQNNVVELKRRTMLHTNGGAVTFGQAMRSALVDAGYGNNVYSDGVQKRVFELRQSCGV